MTIIEANSYNNSASSGSEFLDEYRELCVREYFKYKYGVTLEEVEKLIRTERPEWCL